MNVLDLFSGIGGFSLGLERAGMSTAAFCEIDKHCQRVLKKNWPNALIFDDIKKLKASDMPCKIDLICGGFPCQDISFAGARKGILKGKRSSLWREYRRIIDEIRPSYVIIENVEYLRKNGLGVILRDLFEIGFDSEWHCITARSVGLPHQRDRLWIISYASGERLHEHTRKKRHIQIDEKWESSKIHSKRKQCELKSRSVCPILSSGDFDRLKGSFSDQRAAVSYLRRVTHGVPEGLDELKRRERIKQLGNAVVPQIPELIGRAIIEYEKAGVRP